MDRGPSLSLAAGIAVGVVMAAIPFFFTHTRPVLAAVLFDGGSIIAIVCLILLLVDARARKH